MSILPPELVEYILCHLPVESLKRFRSVSKSWCSLIDSEDFIKSHLLQSIVSSSNRRILIEGLGIASSTCNYVEIVTNSCNGFVLVSIEPPILWNPFSCNYTILPDSCVKIPNPLVYHSKIEYGFAYDSKNDDYKVLKVLESKVRRSNQWVYKFTELYSLKSNSWKTVGNFKWFLPKFGGISRAHVHGAVHTLGLLSERIYSSKIMAFSVESETHYEFMPPQYVMSGSCQPSLDVAGGCLCLIVTYKSMAVLWVMKEYGVKESWNRLLSIALPSMTPNGSVKPLAYSKDKKKVLLTHCNGLIWFDLRKRTHENFHVSGFSDVDCVESLVSLYASMQIMSVK